MRPARDQTLAKYLPRYAAGSGIARNDHVPPRIHRKARQASDELVQEIVRRIVEVADPDRIILFGSGARGDMGRHSDLDFLIIKSGDYSQREMQGALYGSIRSVGCPCDFIVATPESVKRYKDKTFLIYYPALQEGVEVYTHEAIPS